MRRQVVTGLIPLLMRMVGTGVLCEQVWAQQSSSKPDWSAFRFLLGEWTGEGSGNPGQGSGTFTFSMELDDQIIIRHNRSDYPKTNQHPAFSHIDLMVMYQEPGKSPHALYVDNEGHTIRYAADISRNGTSVSFISDSLPNDPRYKLTYSSLPGDSLLITFEIAPAATPNSFVRYLEGKAYRTSFNHSIDTKKRKK